MRLIFLLTLSSSTSNLMNSFFLQLKNENFGHFYLIFEFELYFNLIHHRMIRKQTCFVSSSAIVLPLLTTTLFSRDTERLPETDPYEACFLVAPNLILSNTPAYSIRAPNTKRTQTITHASIAVRPTI